MPTTHRLPYHAAQAEQKAKLPTVGSSQQKEVVEIKTSLSATARNALNLPRELSQTPQERASEKKRALNLPPKLYDRSADEVVKAAKDRMIEEALESI